MPTCRRSPIPTWTRRVRATALGTSTVALLLAGAAPAVAETVTWGDTSTTRMTTDGITAFRTSLDATTFAMEIWVDDDAAPLPGDAELVIDVDVDGDLREDVVATRQPDGSYQIVDAETHAVVCAAPASPTTGATGFAVPAGCVGSPAAVRTRIWLFSEQAGVDLSPEPELATFSDPVTAGPDGPWSQAVRVAVHRFWAPSYANAHFYTVDEDEAVSLVQQSWLPWGVWHPEGVAFSALAPSGDSCDAGAPVRRFWSARYRSHFFTQDETEREHLVTNDADWAYEGVAFCAPASAGTGSVALHRFWSPVFGKHFFTTDEAEVQQIREHDRNWAYEGIAYHVLP